VTNQKGHQHEVALHHRAGLSREAKVQAQAEHHEWVHPVMVHHVRKLVVARHNLVHVAENLHVVMRQLLKV
jgi:hypothetical protein